MQREMFRTVPMVLADAARFGIDANAHHGGWLTAATNAAHVARLRDEVAEARRWGFDEADYRWLDRVEASARINAHGTLGAIHSPHCAVLDPARLVSGLADRAERLGVVIHEGTPVDRIDGRRALTAHGVVRAEVVVRATEAFTVGLPGLRRRVVPLYSMLIATEPLPEATWAEIGWAGREAFTDARHLLIYAQRTADDRLAFGGRGAPYHFGSRLSTRFDIDDRVHLRLLPDALHRLFPAVKDAAITHAWGGPLGAPRDWFASVGFDRSTGSAWAGGYVGDGVSTAHLAGRTLTDLIVGRDSELVAHPWVGHRSPEWEPEPFRWLGINLGTRLAASADAYEHRHLRPSRWRSHALGALLKR
jgi:glycine/D-amino acid oxidase-like deaminating enzyme